MKFNKDERKELKKAYSVSNTQLKGVAVTIMLYPFLYDKLKILAKKTNQSVSSIIRHSLYQQLLLDDIPKLTKSDGNE